MKPKYFKMYMDMAEACSKASVAERLKVGCVIVTESGMVSIGFNGTPRGWYTNNCENTQEDYSLVTKPEVIHAERNALDKMLAEGVSSKGATVFLTHAPCFECAKSLVGAQVDQVIYKNVYRCEKGIDFLTESGIIVSKYTGD